MHRFLYMFFALIFFVACSRNTTETETKVYKVHEDEFISSVTETGELSAVVSNSIPAPELSWRFRQLKIIALAEDGTQVKKGDVLAEFDKSEVQKALLDAQAELEIAEAEYRRAEATQKFQMNDLRVAFEKAKLDHRIAEIELEKAEFESDVTKKELQLSLDQSAITLEKAEKEIDNREIVNKEELKKLQLTINQARLKMQEAQETINKLTISAPTDGIVILEHNWSTDAKVQVDDQVRSGWEIISLPDLSKMQVELEINEVDISKIDTTQACRVRMDAYPDTFFTGKITDISQLARDKSRESKVKVFDVICLIHGSDSRLMPGMTVSCEIIIERIQNSLVIPNVAIFDKDGSDIVYLKKGNSFTAKSVTIGSSNDDFSIVSEGLKIGDVVALIDPTLTEEVKEKEGSE